MKGIARLGSSDELLLEPAREPLPRGLVGKAAGLGLAKHPVPRLGNCKTEKTHGTKWVRTSAGVMLHFLAAAFEGERIGQGNIRHIFRK